MLEQLAAGEDLFGFVGFGHVFFVVHLCFVIRCSLFVIRCSLFVKDYIARGQYIFKFDLLGAS